MGGGDGTTVFKARDHRHDRTVALKIRSAARDHAQLVAEAGVLLSVPPHPLLPLLRDDFFVDGRHVIVMDWVQGTDLGRLLREQGQPALPLTRVLNYLAQAAEALMHLHAREPPVVHGDVKPDNLILIRGGGVALVDLGSSMGDGQARGVRSQNRGFIAPEIAAGDTPTTAADVYALAATAHALLTGRAPSGGELAWEGIDPQTVAAARDPIDRGLALNPVHRPGSPAELIERLRAGWHATLPTGITTFMFTDVVGSTALWDKSPAAMAQALVRHDTLVTEAVQRAGGELIQSMGEGDSTVSVFVRAADGVRAALAAYVALATEPWPEGVDIRIRAALHTGEASLRDGTYFGPVLNRTARLRSLAEANELILSKATAELVAADLPPGVGLVELGHHSLRGFGEPEFVHAVTGPHLTAPPLAICPYRGLASFESEDAELFFGRQAAVDRALDRLRRHRFLAVVGASGSGKSSLARAGIATAVLGGALPGRWNVATLVPGNEPLDALQRALERAENDDAELLVVVDQFEEMFTRCSIPRIRASFVDLLLDAGHTTVLVLRADFYGHCASIPRLAALVSDHQLLLGPMSADELRAAIEEPARGVGLKLEEGLTDLLLADVLGEPGSLPLLSHALVETWERRDGRKLTLAGYQAAGGARGAIARTADLSFEALDATGQGIARRVFLRLIEPGEGTEDTRRRATLSELTAGPADADEVAAVLEELAGARLVTVDAAGVEVAHEALIREWPRLRGWVDDDRERLRSLRQLTRAADQWLAADRDPGELYRGTRLAAAERLDDADLTPLEREYLLASREAVERAQEELRARIVEQARVNRRLRALLVGTIVLLVVAVASGSIAFVQGRRAARETRAATEQLARGLAASAVDLRDSDPFLSIMLATESIARFEPPLPAARSALVESRIALAGRKLVPYGNPIPVGDALTVDVRREGDVAAVGNRDGTVDLWDLTTHERVSRLRGPSAGIGDQGLAFTADGRWLVAGTADGRIWRWQIPLHPDRRTTATGRMVADAGSVVWSLASAPRGTMVAAATQRGDVWLLDASTGRRLRGPPRGASLLSVAFSSDGRTLLTGSLGGRVSAWSVASSRLRFPPIAAHDGGVAEIEARERPAPPVFVTMSSDGMARVWNLRTGARLRRGPFDAADAGVPVGVRGVTLGPDDDTLNLGGPDGAVYSWSLSRRRLVAKTERVHRDQVRSAARSADGTTLVTLGDNRTLQAWTQRPRPDPVQRIQRLRSRATSLAIAPGRRTLVVGTEDGTVRLLDSTKGRERARLRSGHGFVTAAAFDGPARVVTGSSDGTLAVWDAGDGRLLASRARAHRGAISSVAVAHGRQLIVTGGFDDRTVRRFKRATLAPLGEPLGTLPMAITAVALSAEGAIIAAVTQGGDLARWRAAGPSLQPLRVTNDTVWALAFASDGTLATGAADEVLSLWSPGGADEPRRVHALGSHRGGALGVAFVDRATIAVTSGDGRLRLWDAASGAAIGPPVRVSEASVRHVVTSPDGVIWTASDAGDLTRVDALSVRIACMQAAAFFDRRQRARLLAGRPSLACNDSP